MNWRPRSVRGIPDVRFDEPAEGVPAWLRAPIVDWVRGSFYTQGGYIREDALTALQLAFRLTNPLATNRELPDLVARVENDQEFALDVLDWMVTESEYFRNVLYVPEWVDQLNQLLHQGGSAWEVAAVAGGYQLSRRAVGPVVDVLEQTATDATRAHAHLSVAWAKLMGRNPDPSGAYREAVRAVEAVAKPIILPSNDRATLGQIIAAARDKPEKWSTTLGGVDDVRTQMEAVWTGQLDRHGTDDEEIPLNVSHEEADAAFSICLNLVRQFVGGHIALSDD